MQSATQHNNPLTHVTSPLSYTNLQLNTITLYHITSPLALAPFILDFTCRLQQSANSPSLSYMLTNLSLISPKFQRNKFSGCKTLFQSSATPFLLNVANNCSMVLFSILCEYKVFAVLSHPCYLHPKSELHLQLYKK